MKHLLSIFTLLFMPLYVFGQTVRIDTRNHLTGFFRLSQNDFEIDSRSVVASEKAAYAAKHTADTNADGALTYSEYLEFLNITAPNSITAFDLAISKMLPYLTDFSLSSTGGTTGSGILAEAYMAGTVLLPAGAKITLAQDALLVNYDGVLSDGRYTTPNLDASSAVIRFEDATIPKSVLPGSVRDPKILSALFINPREENLILKPDYETSIPKDFRDLPDGGRFLEHVVQRRALPVGFSLLHGVLQSDAGIKTATKLVGVKDIVRAVLDETFAWFRANPPASDGSNFEARRAHSAILDQLGSEFPSIQPGQMWWPFSNSTLYNKAGYESDYLILYYLHKAEQKVLDEIKSTVVANGVRIWKLYNMGIIVKTPEKCFAIDLNPLFVSFAGVLDFAITSHEHTDHSLKLDNRGLMDAKKPIYTAPRTGGNSLDPRMTIIRENKTVTIGSLTITFVLSGQDMGWADVPCLITTIDCGPATGDFTIMHTGDVNHLEAIPAASNVDYLTLHADVGLDTKQAAVNTGAVLADLSHVMELDHTEVTGRMSYRYAFEKIEQLFAKTGATALTWGETLIFSRE